MTPSRASPAPEPSCDKARPGPPGILLLDGRRVLYRSEVEVSTGERRFGGYGVYVSLGDTFEIRTDATAGWQRAHMATLTPHRLHALRVQRQPIVQVIIEPDDVEPSALPDWLCRDGLDPLSPAAFSALQARLWALAPCPANEVTGRIDQALVGHALPPRRLDARVQDVLTRLYAEPAEPHTAQHCAALTGLSVSRFLHLFAAEVGVPFRRLRTWKRVRLVAAEMSRGNQHLTTVALTCGYADAAHFSRSVREAFGLRPSDMLTHNRPAHIIY